MIEGDGEFDPGFSGSELSEFCDKIRDRLQWVKSPKVHDRVEMMLMNYERSGVGARSVASMLNEIKDDFLKIEKDHKDEVGGGQYDDWTRKEVRELYYALYGEELLMRSDKDYDLGDNKPAEAGKAPESEVIEKKKELSKAEKKKVLALVSLEMSMLRVTEGFYDLSKAPEEKLLDVLQKVISALGHNNMENDSKYNRARIENQYDVWEYMNSMDRQERLEFLKEVMVAIKNKLWLR